MHFDLWRILGNDLPPRHASDQTIKNVEFILKHEDDFGMTNKRWCLNRIVDKAKEESLLKLLEGQEITTIPFVCEQFEECPTALEKMQYITNVNEARNLCIALSIEEGADVILPMDGGMFFRTDGWMQFRLAAEENPEDGYFAFPTWRVKDEESLLAGDPPQLRCEYRFGKEIAVGLTELQLAFTPYADKRFNPELMYGKADKVELLYRLGLLGLWDRWEPELRAEVCKDPSEFYGEVKKVGFVSRLPSGNAEADHNNQLRGAMRAAGIYTLLSEVENKPCCGVKPSCRK